MANSRRICRFRQLYSQWIIYVCLKRLPSRGAVQEDVQKEEHRIWEGFMSLQLLSNKKAACGSLGWRSGRWHLWKGSSVVQEDSKFGQPRVRCSLRGDYGETARKILAWAEGGIGKVWFQTNGNNDGEGLG